MENLILKVSPCGCPTLFVGEQPVIAIPLIDSEKRPFEFIKVGWIEFVKDEVTTRRNINLVFPDNDAAFLYLNTTFVETWGYEGVFTPSGDFINYSNNENFETAEIMIEFGLKHLVCSIGTPNPTTTKEGGFDIEFDNGSSFSSVEFFGMLEVGVSITNIKNEPVEGDTGHTYISEDIDNPGMGTFSFPFNLENTIMYITLSQKPAA